MERSFLTWNGKSDSFLLGLLVSVQLRQVPQDGDPFNSPQLEH
jgi:hypothetical protein